MTFLAISGSLRARSTTTAVLEAAIELAPSDVTVELWRGLATLPHFNPDDDTEPAAEAVAAFRAALRAADALIVCSPEYAHGVPGVLKNALDWVVGSGELIEKPVALINASPYATFAYASLAETLRTMSARIVADASVTLPIRSGKPNAAAILASPEISGVLRAALGSLAAQTASSTVSPADR
jgi:NAD(P)H-dependent FMN reductase